MSSLANPDPQANSKLLPQYTSKEQCYALRIHAVDQIDEGFVITPAEPGYGPFPKPTSWGVAYNPQPGQYYVVFANGDCVTMDAHKFRARWQTAEDSLVALAGYAEAMQTVVTNSTARVCRKLLKLLEGQDPPQEQLLVDQIYAATMYHQRQLEDGWTVVFEYDGEGKFQHILHFLTPEDRTVDFWKYPESPERTKLILWPER